MCATCVAQGVVYVGGALTGLQVMGARARARRRASEAPEAPEARPTDDQPDAERPSSDRRAGEAGSGVRRTAGTR